MQSDLASHTKIWSVSELNRVIREFFEQTFYPLWIRGEIGNLTIHRSGHVYFTIKDDRSQIKIVFFRGANTARKLNLQVGDEVDVWGHLSVYEVRGEYQIIARKIQPCGTGALRQKFEELKNRLREEGLFDEERKRAIPTRPKRVGVITSPQGAALRDFLQVLSRRFSNIHVRIFPASVQGDNAAKEIVEGITFFNKTKDCDVLIVTRGGGSLEDIWPFNEESVARAVAESNIPVISAVGHEVDFTICDFAADLRVATPSAAAELVIQKKEELLERISTLRRRLQDQLQIKLSELRRRTDKVVHHPVFREPRNAVRLYAQQVDDLQARLARAQQKTLQDASSLLENLQGKLQAMNPHQVLARGYAVLLKENTDEPVTNAEYVKEGERLQALLHRGRLNVRNECSIAPDNAETSYNTEDPPNG